jgi:hypothetical protein
MSTFGLESPRRRERTIEDLNPGQALKHEGNYGDTYDRIRATLRLANKLGREGLTKVAPYLPKFIADDRNLRVAWDHLCEHGGRSVGPDEVDLLSIPESRIWPWLKWTGSLLKSGEYRATVEDERICRISKGPGRGERALAVQNHLHRLVQKAALQVLDPLLDPKLDDRCFGGRLGRGPHMALATAEWMLYAEGLGTWITEDLRDAYCCVPIPRLLQILAKHIPDVATMKLIKRMLAGSRTPGLRQGGALSPLFLAIYLDVVVVRKWRKLHPDIPLLLFVDDILLMCRSADEAREARQSLIKLLNGTGMRLKYSEKESLRYLNAAVQAKWLGFQIRKESGRLISAVPDIAIDKLLNRLDPKTRMPEEVPSESGESREQDALRAWLNYYGPCFVTPKEVGWTFTRIAARIRDRNLPLRIDPAEFADYCRDACDGWLRTRERVACVSTRDRSNEVMIPDWLTY